MKKSLVLRSGYRPESSPHSHITTDTTKSYDHGHRDPSFTSPHAQNQQLAPRQSCPKENATRSRPPILPMEEHLLPPASSAGTAARMKAKGRRQPSATTAGKATARQYHPEPHQPPPPPPPRRPASGGGGGGGCGATRTFMESTTPLLLEMVMLRMLGEIRSCILPLPLPRRRELRLRRPRVPATAAARRWHWAETC